MACVGIDLGNENNVVAIARKRGIDVILNSESKRESLCAVGFGPKQRAIGTAAAAQLTMNMKNTITQVKRLIGRKFKEPAAQRDLAGFPYRATEGPDGEIQLHVQFMGADSVFSPEQVLGMILGDLKAMAEKDNGSKIGDFVVGVPCFYTDQQRRAMIDAAKIGGVNVLRLMNETTAVALDYGIFKTDLPEEEPLKVVFVDVGHSALQCSVVAFKKGQLKVLAHTFDRDLGGRDLDMVLVDHFAKEFLDKYKIDVKSNFKATLKLRTACEKLKKVLSANPEAPLNVECLMNDIDVKSHITRDLFEELADGVLSRAKQPILNALEIAGVKPEEIFAVELVGSASRTPSIVKTVEGIFKKHSRTLNASESVSKGCALQCAMLSPVFRVREFEVQDVTPMPINIAWKKTKEDGTEEISDNEVFGLMNACPCTKLLTFFRSETFQLDCRYSDPSLLPEGVPAELGSFKIGPFKTPANADKAKLKVKLRLNLHGILSVENAHTIEEEEVVEAEPMATDAPKEDAPADGDKKEDAPMEDAKTEAKEESTPADGKKEEAPKKTKIKRTDVPVNEEGYGGIQAATLAKAVEQEYELALQDRVMEETKDKKNDVEEYVYSMRNKLCDSLSAYVTEPERESFSKVLNDTEDWLYEDGEDETKGVYIAKMVELKKIGDPIVQRFTEDSDRPAAASKLTQAIKGFQEMCSAPEYEHIDQAEKEKVVAECKAAEAWLADKLGQQAQLPKTAPPAVVSKDIEKKLETLERFARPVMSKPKPKPAPPPAEESKSMDAEETGAAEGEAKAAEEPKPDTANADSKAMDVD
mmetsp:Transcript_9470/g.34743  ORF Transcript_9470/g.34743 Transcript_9470/m.34743 type:complete len:813 (-) Transcript_9470:278-2716(-)|eukprot:scaffold1261_cov377-Prasinococcus_capsulatus_cf.AAC.2